MTLVSNLSIFRGYFREREPIFVLPELPFQGLSQWTAWTFMGWFQKHSAALSRNPHHRIMNGLLTSVIGTKGPTAVAWLMLILYDHILTLDDEIQTLWIFPLNAPGVLLLLTRYLNIVIRMVDLLLFFRESWSPHVPVIFAKTKITRFGNDCNHNFSPCLVTFKVIMVLRIYALYGGHGATLCRLLLFVAVEAVLFCLSLYNGFGTPPAPNPGCITGAVYPIGINCVYWVIPLVAETVIFILTIRKCNHYAKLVTPVPFLKIFLRDGFLYYVALASTHVLNLLLFLLAPNSEKASGSGFGQTLTSILISRLVFNLRKQSLAKESHHHTAHLTQTETPSWYFTSVRNLGSIYTLFNVDNPQIIHNGQQETNGL